jgi:PrtD family type I secretion system ABC transporter
MNDHPLHPLLARQRAAIGSIALFSVATSLLALTLPLYMLGVFANVLTSRSADTLLMLTAGAVLALALQGALDTIRARLLARTGITIDAQLAPSVLVATLRHAAGATGRSAQPLRDAAEVRALLTGPAIFDLFDAPFVPVYLLVIFLLHPLLGLVALAGACALIALALLNERIARKPIGEALDASRRAQARADEYVRHADALAAMGMIPAAQRRWQALQGRALARLARGTDTTATSRTVARLMRMLLQVALYAVGAWLYLDNRLMVGAIVAASVLTARALAPLEGLIGSWRNTVGAWQAYRRLGALLASPRAGTGPTAPRLGPPRGRLELDQVVVPAPQGNRILLRGISFTLEPGECLGIVGPSGAGKSTLARAIVGLIEPRAGKVRLDGFELAAWDRDALGRHVGYLPQDVQLLNGSVHENIARLETGDADALSRAAELAGLRDLVAALPRGFDTPIGEEGEQLSAGQRQHVALARALYGDPRLVVLDEPDAHLDGAGEAALTRAIGALHRLGVTLVIITHRPSLLQQADKLLVLRNGSVERYGPRAQLIGTLTAPSTARAAASGIPAITTPREARATTTPTEEPSR